VTETPSSPSAEAPAPPPPVAPSAPTATPAVLVTTHAGNGRWIAAGAALLAALATAALVLAWNTQQRVKSLEAELVRRQQDSGTQAAEARVLAKQAETTSREIAAKQALLEARVAETTLQRTQIEELIQSLARSRDENVLADIEASLRVALQQTAITGSADPLVLTLKQADERLARFNQPRLERVRRAVAQDLDRVRAAGVTDIAVLSIRLDEVIRLVDDLPLLSAPERRAAAAPAVAAPASAAASSGGWGLDVPEKWRNIGLSVWGEVQRLVRVTRIEHPEGMLVAPEQAWFLRENLKLRLLNARLALLSRQFDTAQSDLRDAQAALDRYFERSARRVAMASEQVRQISAQARLVTVPRPDATLAAIATVSAGR